MMRRTAGVILITLLLLAAVIIPAGAVNIFIAPDQVNDSAWSKYYTYKVFNDTVLAPDGTTTADTLNVSGGLAIHYLGQTVTFASLGNYTLGAAIKKHGVNDIIQLALPSARFGTGQFVNANLSDCSIASGGTVNSTATVSSIDNGFCQVTLKSYATSTGTGSGLFIFTGNTDSTRAPEFQGTGNTTHAIAIWNMSIEFNNDSGTTPPPTPDLDGSFLPVNHIARYNISLIGKHASSNTWINSISTQSGGNTFKVYQGYPGTAPTSGKRILYVNNTVPMVPVAFTGVLSQSDLGGSFAWPDDYWWDTASGDGNMYVYNTESGLGYEFSRVGDSPHPNGIYPNGTHGAGTGNIYDYTNLTIHRPIGTSAGSVSGMQRIPLILTYADINSTSPINHALECSYGTVNAANVSDVLWPASATTTIDGVNASWPKMGARFRLKNTTDLSHLQAAHPQAYKVAIALRDYGGFLDIRSAAGINVNAEMGVLSASDYNGIQDIHVTDFEFVDESSLMSAANSYAVLGYVLPEEPEPIPPTASFVPVSTDSITPEGIANVTFHSTTETTGTTTYNWTCRNFTPGNNTVLLFSNNTANPFKQFTAGNWIVNLEVTDLNGANITPDFSHQVNVSQLSAPYAAFTKSKMVVMLPSGIYFNDTSDGATSWNWSFGDGGYSDDKNATHRYRQTGRFIVNLTINDGASTALSTVFAIRPSFMEF